MSIIEGHERVLGREAVIDSLQRRVPGVFGQQAPANTLKDLLVNNPRSVFYQTLGLGKKPLMAQDDVVDMRAETGLPLDDIYIGLKRLRNHGNFNLHFGLKVHGAYNFSLGYGTYGQDSTSSQFTAHWANYTPLVVVDPASRVTRFENTDTPVKAIPFEELTTDNALALIERTQNHHYNVKIQRVEVDETRGLVAIQYRLVNKVAIYGKEKAATIEKDTFEIVMPLTVKVDLQGQDFAEAISLNIE